MTDDYWKQREAENYVTINKTLTQYNKEIEAIYTSLNASIDKEIKAFYAEYAQEAGITMAEAKKAAATADIKNFKAKYIEYAKNKTFKAKYIEYAKNKTFTKTANEEMALYDVTTKVNRLQLLKANIGVELVKYTNDLDVAMQAQMQAMAEGFYAQQAGILADTIIDNAKAAEVIVNGSFKNATFSERIWANQDILRAEIDKALQQTIIRGAGNREVAEKLQEKIKVTQYEAERLVRTETSRMQTEVRLDSYEKAGIEHVKFVANTKTACKSCLDLDGEIFERGEIVISENAPPIHPNCMCALSPVMTAEEEKKYQEWLNSL